jgi:hypothetical protein
MRVGVIAAGAALFAGLIINAGSGTPAWAICLPLWGTICRPDASPSADTAATAPEVKPHKPLSLRAVAHKGDKRTRVAARHRQPAATKQASHNIVTARSRVAAGRRLASVRRRPHIVRRQDREQAPQVSADAASAGAARSGTANPPQTDGFVLSQDDVTALDLAADQPKPAAAEAPNPALWNAVTPTDPAANSGVDPSTDAAAAATVAPATNQVASAETASADNASAVAATPAQQPADEPSWLRRIMIGLGGVLTLASAVRLFMG